VLLTSLLTILLSVDALEEDVEVLVKERVLLLVEEALESLL